MYFYTANVRGIRLNYGSWKESWLVTLKSGWRKDIQQVKWEYIANMCEYIHRDVLFNVGLSTADKNTSRAIRRTGKRTAYMAKLESRWDWYTVSRRPTVFLHDIIVDECRHELQTKAQIKSIRQQAINLTRNSTAWTWTRTFHGFHTSLRAILLATFQRLGLNNAQKPILSSLVFVSHHSERNSLMKSPATSIWATRTSRFYPGSLGFDSSLRYSQPQHVLCCFLQYLSWRQVPSTPFP